jgi:hypothetical protein
MDLDVSQPEPKPDPPKWVAPPMPPGFAIREELTPMQKGAKKLFRSIFRRKQPDASPAAPRN